MGSGSNPRVIHFDKSLYPETPSGTPTNAQGFTSDQLKTFFSQNVLVGTCGSNQEAPFQAGKLAVAKALEGTQLDTYDASGTPGSFPAGWPHADSKMVLVFVGDEDDCSSPQDANGGVVLSGAPGSDACVNDSALPVEQQRLFTVGSMVDYFTGLDRPLGAAVIASAKAGTADTCVDDTCSPAICCDTACTGSAAVCTTTTCGGQGKGTRLLEAAGELRAAAADVIAGSICDPNFGTILDRIAELAKPPSGLLLPSQPADEQVCVLRIARADGKTRKTCFGPAPAGLTTAEAEAASYDWWFTATREQVTDDQKAPTAASRYVYLNQQTENCKADTGETYSADYLGRLPAGGCYAAPPWRRPTRQLRRQPGRADRRLDLLRRRGRRQRLRGPDRCRGRHLPLRDARLQLSGRVAALPRLDRRCVAPRGASSHGRNLPSGRRGARLASP